MAYVFRSFVATAAVVKSAAACKTSKFITKLSEVTAEAIPNKISFPFALLAILQFTMTSIQRRKNFVFRTPHRGFWLLAPI